MVLLAADTTARGSRSRRPMPQREESAPNNLLRRGRLAGPLAVIVLAQSGAFGLAGTQRPVEQMRKVKHTTW